MPNIEEPITEEIDSIPDVSHPRSGINIGGNTVTENTAHIENEDQRNLLRWIHTVARDNNWDFDELVTQTKISSTTFYRIWADKYRDPKTKERIPLDSVCDKLAKFKKVFLQRNVGSKSFVETSVWDRVNWICQRTYIRQKIGFIFGESQGGKTTCVKEYQRRNNHGQTTYCEIPPSAGVQLMTKTIARALHVSTSTCYSNLIEDVCGALDDSKLLIIDEVHRVFTTYQKTSVMRCLDVLRYIHDQTKCGLVLCGTNVFRDELKQGQFFQYLKQLERRGLYQLQLPTQPPRGDLDLFAASFNLPPATDAAEEHMLHIAKTYGVGMFVTRLTDAAELASNKRQQLTWDHFLKACAIIEKMKLEN